MRPNVKPNEIQCPNTRAPALTEPEIVATRSAGQHHAPIKDGIPNINVKKLTIKLYFVPFSVVNIAVVSTPSFIPNK